VEKKNSSISSLFLNLSLFSVLFSSQGNKFENFLTLSLCQEIFQTQVTTPELIFFDPFCDLGHQLLAKTNPTVQHLLVESLRL